MKDNEKRMKKIKLYWTKEKIKSTNHRKKKKVSIQLKKNKNIKERAKIMFIKQVNIVQISKGKTKNS